MKRFNFTNFSHKKTLKSFFSFLVVLLLIVPFTLSAFADSFVAVDNPLTVINRYRPDSSVSYTIASQKQLFGFSNNTYTLYQLSPYGYAILMDSPCRLMEASYDENAVPPIDMSDSSKYYYGGPMSYCKTTNEGMLNVYDNTLLTADQIEKITLKEADVCLAKQATVSNISTVNLFSTTSTSSLEIYTVEYYYFAYLTEYAENTVGTCSAVAAQILLGYYDSFVNDDVVASQYEVDAYTGHGTSDAFSDVLFDYIYYDQGLTPGGVGYYTAINGINDYLESRALCMYLSSTTYESRYIELIQQGYPLYIGMYVNGDTDSGHACVAYRVQFEENDPTGTAIFTVNMGWDSGSNFQSPPNCHLLIDGDWLFAGSYMINTNHTYRFLDYNAFTHTKTCRTCSTVFYESHSPYWNTALEKCTRCGRTGVIGITGVTSIHDDCE